MNKKLLALVLALTMLAPSVISCSNNESDETKGGTTVSGDNTSVDGDSADEETETSRADIKDSLPEDLNFGGDTVNIYHFGTSDTINYDTVGEMGGDVVLDAVYNRNISVEDRLNVKLNYIEGAAGWNDFPNEVLTALNAGTTDYDVIMEESTRLWQQSFQGYYHDLIDEKYLDLDAPWWYGDMMEESAIDNSRRFFLNGDICLTVMLGASATYFNKGMFENYFGDISALYNAVLDGTWTYDKLMEYCRGVYTDVNGNGELDSEDITGFRYETWGLPNHMSMSTGLEYITRDENGYPVLDLLSETTIKWSETLYKLLYSDNMAQFDESGKTSSFISGLSLFLPGTFSTANSLRDVDFEYGMLPYPKLDETLDYKSAAGTANGNGVAIPVTIGTERTTDLCAVLEALCAESYRKVTPAWYDTALKVKYADGLEDAQMVDIIYEHIGSPFIMMADKELGTGSVFTYGVLGDSSEGYYVSYYESKKSSLEANLADIIEQYKNIEG